MGEAMNEIEFPGAVKLINEKTFEAKEGITFHPPKVGDAFVLTEVRGDTMHVTRTSPVKTLVRFGDCWTFETVNTFYSLKAV